MIDINEENDTAGGREAVHTQVKLCKTGFADRIIDQPCRDNVRSDHFKPPLRAKSISLPGPATVS
jgi:hypothetical protein